MLSYFTLHISQVGFFNLKLKLELNQSCEQNTMRYKNLICSNGMRVFCFQPLCGNQKNIVTNFKAYANKGHPSNKINIT
jgi:hypothetical protein